MNIKCIIAKFSSMKSQTHKDPIQPFAWLLIALMSIMGSGQLPVLCLDPNGDLVIEAICVPGAESTNISLDGSKSQTNRDDCRIYCVDFPIEENARIRSSNQDLSFQITAVHSMSISFIRLPERNAVISFKSATDSRPTRLALMTVVLLV